MTPELQAIAQRLEAAEKEIARLAALIAEHSGTDGTVVAQNFVLRDRQGKQRAVLGMVTPVGQTEEQSLLGLFDANESLRACMSVDAEGGLLVLQSVKGHVVAEIRESEDGPRVALFDASGSTRLSLKVSQNGSFAYLFSPDGKQHLRIELFSSGQESIVMQDASGEVRLFLVVREGGRPALHIGDFQGCSAVLGSTTVLGRAGEQFETSAASLVLIGKDGKVIGSVPPLR